MYKFCDSLLNFIKMYSDRIPKGQFSSKEIGHRFNYSQ
uniref:Uncharacterized protein n=1 Tax=Anguilla anguilla TaxID=7936 RepID=A0A0E9S1Y3_ANGAN